MRIQKLFRSERHDTWSLHGLLLKECGQVACTPYPPPLQDPLLWCRYIKKIKFQTEESNILCFQYIKHSFTRSRFFSWNISFMKLSNINSCIKIIFSWPTQKILVAVNTMILICNWCSKSQHKDKSCMQTIYWLSQDEQISTRYIWYTILQTNRSCIILSALSTHLHKNFRIYM